MPNINKLTVWLTVKSYDGLDIDLPFQEADTIVLSGNISRFVPLVPTTIIH